MHLYGDANYCSSFLDTLELKILTKSYMETLKKDFKDLHQLLIPANAVKMTEVIGEGMYVCMCVYMFSFLIAINPLLFLTSF